MFRAYPPLCLFFSVAPSGEQARHVPHAHYVVFCAQEKGLFDKTTASSFLLTERIDVCHGGRG